MTPNFSFSRRLAWLASPRFWTLSLSIFGTSACLVLCLYSYVFNDKIYVQTNALSASWLASIDALSKIRAQLNEARRAEAFIVFGGNCGPDGCRQEVLRRRRTISDFERNYEKNLIASPEEGVMFRSYIRERTVYFALQDDLLEKADTSDSIRKSFLAESADAYTDVLRSITDLNDYNLDGAKEAQKDITQDYKKGSTLLAYLIGLLAVNIVILLGRAMFLATRSKTDGENGAD